ncbi:putative disease resistance protein RGA4 [Gossypium arboreum]|uniref:putative disease resistance protein RGA4 n=1 Tax=Gossypium arboreum TaxID=29729 RepID=UPI0008197197|nr:putative disease resistance protein RGA4 [Gossypium arboreum]
MAETFLFDIAERVLAKIGHLSVDEVRLAFNVKTDLKKLEDIMISIKAVLLDAERQQHQNEKLRLCMWKLRDIFYDAEDLIDDFKCEALRKQDAINHPNINNLKVRVLGSFRLPFSFYLKIAHKIKDINGRLGELATEWNSFGLRQCNDSRHVFCRETISFVDSSDVIGRDEDKENIISMLMKPSEDRNVPVIPVVGIGGLGKTTLAQFVYNDDRVTSLFPLKIWICVSEEFDLSRLLKLIIQSVNKGERCDDSTLDALQARLRSLLNDKKFLIVLDDVWNENQAKWVELRNFLRSTNGFSPSKIIVTTRSLKVASIMSSIPPYILEGLPLEDCLTLFTKWAFNDGDERHYPNLIRIGEEIVKKCKGVPLAVRTLGSLLFQKTDESDWIYIRESEIWRLEQHENDILPVLKMSYNHLPSHLQRCFAFLSLYKKDEIYYSDRVIRLWMANGLLEHPKQNQEWEDVGKRYLNELLSRCLIQMEYDFGLYFNFKMHDLVHDLALDVSQKECKTVNSKTETVDENVRHLLLCEQKLVEVPRVLEEMKNVRTLIIQDVSKASINESLINLCVSNFKYLRALALRRSPLRALPNCIGTLKHLRDLDLAHCGGIQKLPSSFDKLRSLQSLNLEGSGLKLLPDSVQRLIELRHLEMTVEAKHLKEIRAGCWTSLQYLRLGWCKELECLPEGMQYLKSLRTLVLVFCHKLVSLPRSLKFLTKLEHLEIKYCQKINLEMEVEEEEDKDLQLSLKTFSLLELNALRDLPRLLLQGSSSTLQQLQICWCPNLSVLPARLLNLTSLHKLEIVGCIKLSAQLEGIERLTNLTELTIHGCPELSKRYRENAGKDWHKFAHIQKVVIKNEICNKIIFSL